MKDNQSITILQNRTLNDYKQFVGKMVSATSANTYETIRGKCVSVRETVTDYTDVTKGILFLVDIENAGMVKVGLAQTAQITE